MKWKYLKKKFRYNPKRAFLFLFLFFFLTSFTIGYAFLTKELSIEGSSTLVGATWDIHFENIQVKSGSVTPTTAATITNPTSITFGVTLENPGDFYEFNVDVVNDGTFNAMIDSYSFLPVLTAEQQEYLEYTVTYSEGVPLAVYQKLDAGTQETLRIRFGYIDGVDASLYPLTDQELTIEVEIVYVQADENAIKISLVSPVLDDGMIPVTIANDGTVTAVSSNNPSWFDYDNKIWANAILVKESGVKTRAQNKVAGTVINQDDILAYFVWIPRYSYKIWTLDASSDHTGDEQTIDIKFVDKNTKENGSAVGSYYTHPAFTFGTEELPGFWAGKFESSIDPSSTCYTSPSEGYCNNANHSPRIVPNVKPLIYQTVGNQFATSLKFAGGSQSGSTVTFVGNRTYGLTASSDSHMMKNSEWGAVSYLSHSNYGINGEIRINNFYNSSGDTYKTGFGAGTANASTTNTTTGGIVYGSASSYPQSTTGNISGVFDMSGGTWEYVMGNFNGTIGNAGFSTLPTSKYYDNYPSSTFTGNYSTNFTFCTLATCGGHALNETRNWYNDTALFIYSSYPWFYRGGHTFNSQSAGAFYLSYGSGNTSPYYGISWRGVLVAR